MFPPTVQRHVSQYSVFCRACVCLCVLYTVQIGVAVPGCLPCECDCPVCLVLPVLSVEPVPVRRAPMRCRLHRCLTSAVPPAALRVSVLPRLCASARLRGSGGVGRSSGLRLVPRSRSVGGPVKCGEVTEP